MGWDGRAYTRLLKIEYGEATDISDSIHVDGKFPEKVDDAITAFRQRPPENERREYHTQDFFNKYCHLHRVELHELSFHLSGSAVMGTKQTAKNLRCLNATGSPSDWAYSGYVV